MASPPRPDSGVHVDPVQHPTDPSIFSGQNGISSEISNKIEKDLSNEIANSIGNDNVKEMFNNFSSSLSSRPSSSSDSPASALRKLSPVSMFSTDSSSMGSQRHANPDAVNMEIPVKKESATSALDAPLFSPMPAPISRQLPPVPKFSANNFPMGPPPSKPSVASRGLMPPPPVPKFGSLWGEKTAMRPPKWSPILQPVSADFTANMEPKSSVQEQLHVEESKTVANLSRLEKNGGTDAGDTNLERSTLALPGSVRAGDGAVQGNGAAAGEGGRLPVRGESSKSELHPAAGASPSQIPYLIPSWSATPGQPYSMEILKEGNILGIEDVSIKGAYMFGRSDRCDFVLEHPTVSRYHAVLQFNSKGESFMFDLGSTHGTFINKLQVNGKEYVPLHVGDIVRFGYSSRLYAFQGPLNLMPKEGLSKKDRQAQRLIEAVQDRAIKEASLIRGRRDAMASDGISWGMQEDAEEEEEENTEEITWQTFKGELTEKQQKTLEKIHRHNEKLSNLKKENDAIQAKEISQGGLTQGQQTQTARNEQRMEQLVEEVESMEETLNESIQESINGRTGRKRRGKKDLYDEEDEDDLSDDEFYDRASKLQPQKRKDIVQKVETADSLLNKKAALTAEIKGLHEAIKAEMEKTSSSSQEKEVKQMELESEDPLDQFMTDLSSTILKDRASHLQKEVDALMKELERVERLLKIADPTSEGLRKWELKKSVEGSQVAESLTSKNMRAFPRKEDAQHLATSVAEVKNGSNDILLQVDTVAASEGKVNSDNDHKNVPFEEETTVLPGLEPPVRLGAPIPEASEEGKVEFSDKVNEDAMSFVTYKDRNKADSGRHKTTVAELVEKSEGPKLSAEKKNESVVDVHVADSVALLLRHKRGLLTSDALDSENIEHGNPIASVEEKPPLKKSSRKRKKHGAPIPSHTIDTDSTEEWVPPPGQTGDGRTSLNDKYGY